MTKDIINLDELIEQANDLAPLSPTSVLLAELISDPNFYMDEVTDLIAYDQALTLKLLRVANSAANGTAERIGSVKEAVNRLGIAQVLAFTVASKVKTLLQPGIPAYELDEGALWRHSVAAAVSVETMQPLCRVVIPPEAFTAALLHDVGKLIMGRFLNPEIVGYIRCAKEADHLGEMEAESLLLAVHHAEVGGLIAQHWKLPPRIVQGISYHHNPDEGADVICDVTYVANQLAKYIEADISGRKTELFILPAVAQRLELTPEAIGELGPKVVARYLQVSSRYNSI